MNIQHGTPTEPGLYVAYVESDIPLMPMAKPTLMMFIDGQWIYPFTHRECQREVHGWVGPLPSLRIEA